jgi:hypothetical protein
VGVRIEVVGRGHGLGALVGGRFGSVRAEHLLQRGGRGVGIDQGSVRVDGDGLDARRIEWYADPGPVSVNRTSDGPEPAR